MTPTSGGLAGNSDTGAGLTAGESGVSDVSEEQDNKTDKKIIDIKDLKNTIDKLLYITQKDISLSFQDISCTTNFIKNKHNLYIRSTKCEKFTHFANISKAKDSCYMKCKLRHSALSL